MFQDDNLGGQRDGMDGDGGTPSARADEKRLSTYDKRAAGG